MNEPLQPQDSGEPLLEEGEQRLSRRELEPVIARIQSLMSFWGITLEELDAPTPPPPPPAGPLPIKYRHPVSGDTWDGQGPHPEWLRHALLKEGLRVEELKPMAADNTQAPAP